MRRTMASLIALTMLAAACSGTGSDATTSTTGAPTGTSSTTGGTTGSGTTGTGVGPTSPGGTGVAVAERFDPSEVQFVAALERFDRCETFLDYIKAEALARVGPYGLDGPVFGPFPRFAAEESFAFADTAAADGGRSQFLAAPQAGVDFSDTNVQVLGVDEPDVVKTDGNRILAIVDGDLSYVDVTGDDPVLRDSIHVGDGWNHRFFMGDDRVLVFADAGGGGIPEPLASRVAGIISPYQSMVTITEIDTSDPDNLRIARTLRVQGSFVSARAVDGTVRVVLSSYPAGLNFVYPSGPAAEDIALETNRKIIENSTLETWLPTYVLTSGNDVLDDGVIADCNRIHRPAEFAGFEMLSVLTMDIDAPLAPGDATTVTARGETVYATAENLYVATNVWVPEDVTDHPDAARFAERYSTAIHKFDISGDSPAEYLASGSVEGHLLNQFSLGEHDGRLQIATTAGAPWWFTEDAESFVWVLNQDGDRLVEIGKVGDLGRGERIFAARFIEDVAYVVTFRQVDPLYIVDLSEPSRPRVTGELKIPGYSAYLHPIGPGRLLGVGQNATDEGFTTGAKVSLFDVSDPTDPRELDSWTLNDGYTEAEWDHLAFLYWDREDLAVLPIQAWSSGFFGAVALKTDDGLREYGRVEHDPDKSGFGDSKCRQVTSDELGGGGFFGSDALIQVCGEDEPGGATGYYCNEVPAEELEFMREELGTDLDIEDLVDPGERLEICWPEYEEGHRIIRSLVIGDNLWTLSRTLLQANDLGDLDVVHEVKLG